ncbi:MAG: tetratricopeptide repeat protein [Chlamydiales bacterium]|nr:tetratricopeptide repeat protein [Chlamydiales bacterium]
MDKEAVRRLLTQMTPAEKMSSEEAKKFYAFGFSLYGAGSAQEAIDVFEVLCVQRPLEAKHWFGLAASLQERSHYEKALPAWAMAAILDQSNPHPHFHAAECCFAQGKQEEARIALEAALIRSEQDSVLQDRIALLQHRWNQ